MDHDVEQAPSTQEAASTTTAAPTVPSVAEKHDPYEVTLEPADDPAVAFPLWRRWLAALIINAGAICVTGASAMVSLRFIPAPRPANADRV